MTGTYERHVLNTREAHRRATVLGVALLVRDLVAKMLPGARTWVYMDPLLGGRLFIEIEVPPWREGMSEARRITVEALPSELARSRSPSLPTRLLVKHAVEQLRRSTPRPHLDWLARRAGASRGRYVLYVVPVGMTASGSHQKSASAELDTLRRKGGLERPPGHWWYVVDSETSEVVAGSSPSGTDWPVWWRRYGSHRLGHRWVAVTRPRPGLDRTSAPYATA